MGKRRNKSTVELAAAVMRDVREGRAKLAAMGDYVAVEPVKLRSHEPCNYDDCQWPGQCDGRHCLEAGGAVRLTPEEMQEREAPMQSNVELLAQAMTLRVLADAPESKGPFVMECDQWVSPMEGTAIIEAWTHAFKKAGREPPPPLLVLGAGFRLRSVGETEAKPAKPQTPDEAIDAAVDALAKVLQTHPYTDEAGRIALANTIGAAVLARLATKR
jgi:hypothetical protein